MKSRKIAALAAGALLLASTAAPAQTTGSGAGALSLAGAMQSSADTGGEGMSTTTVVLMVGILFAVLAIAVISGNDEDFDQPSSP